MPSTVRRAAGRAWTETTRPRFIHVTKSCPNKKPMPTPAKKTSKKLGANRKETAHTARTKDANFAQSRDIREDRGERQMKAARERQTMPHLKNSR